MSLLDEIVGHKLREVAASRVMRPIEAVREAVPAAPPPRDFAGALRRAGPALIAEIKTASPSAGAIRPRADIAAVARAYERAGAAAISVLTDRAYFGGSADDLVAARGAVSVPVLRKDFVVDPYQVYESRALGADAILLIAAILGDDDLASLHDLARHLGMAALVEVHTPDQADAAVRIGAQVIGINNRNLDTLAVDLATTARVRPRIPADRIVVSESGITGPNDVRALAAAGADAILVGTTLMASRDPEEAARALLLSSQAKG